MKKQRSFKNLLIKIVGVGLILLGIIGTFLPFLQGLLMISAGLALLGNKKAKNLCQSNAKNLFLKIKKYAKETYTKFSQRK